MPEIDRAIPMPLEHGELGLGKRWRIGRELRASNYRQAILLPNSMKSALVPFFAGIPLRTGWRGEMRYGLLNDLRVLDEAALPLMVQRFVALGLDSGEDLPDLLPQPGLRVDRQQALDCAAEFGLAPGRPILALCPGAEFGPAKCWPTDHYARLADHFLARDWQVALYGSGNDRQVCSEIAQRAGGHERCHDLSGRTSLAQAVDLLSLSTAVVSNDSGLMHIAAAVGRPLLAIYGATSPDFTPPMGPDSALLVSDIDCAPCFARECPLGHHRCMLDMSPERALEALERLLEDRG
jgi:heptosyltransferase-2